MKLLKTACGGLDQQQTHKAQEFFFGVVFFFWGVFSSSGRKVNFNLEVQEGKFKNIKRNRKQTEALAGRSLLAFQRIRNASNHQHHTN